MYDTICLLLLLGCAAQVIAIVSRTDGTRAASIGTDGCLRLWDTATGDCLSNKVGVLPGLPARNFVTLSLPFPAHTTACHMRNKRHLRTNRSVLTHS
jgi:WD40 repeat protein